MSTYRILVPFVLATGLSITENAAGRDEILYVPRNEMMVKIPVSGYESQRSYSKPFLAERMLIPKDRVTRPIPEGGFPPLFPLLRITYRERNPRETWNISQR